MTHHGAGLLRLTKDETLVAQLKTDWRQADLSDADILDINQITGYYAYVNRLADGLGVELEDFWQAK